MVAEYFALAGRRTDDTWLLTRFTGDTNAAPV